MDVPFFYFVYAPFYFDLDKSMKWMEKYWSLCFLFAAIYLLFIYLGQRYKQNRLPHQLDQSLFVWNLLQALFSLVGSYKLVRFILKTWSKHGFQGTVCIKPSILLDPGDANDLAYWGLLYAISKVLELGDTVFIVLRKRKLVFLHWYHHITVMIYAWFSLSDLASTCIWFTTINLLVHAAMYTYYALSTKYKIPRIVAMVITLGQILQMVFGLYINWHAYGALSRNEKCDVEYRNIASSMIMYASYWVLFANLFYWNYARKGLKGKLM